MGSTPVGGIILFYYKLVGETMQETSVKDNGTSVYAHTKDVSIIEIQDMLRAGKVVRIKGEFGVTTIEPMERV